MTTSDGRGPDNDLTELTRILQKTLKYLESIGLDAETVGDFAKLLAYLRSRNAHEAKAILGRPSAPPRPAKTKKPSLSVEEILAMSLTQLSALVGNMDATRKELEHVATHRFALSRGALSNLRTLGALREKLNTMISHEHAHDAIQRVAGVPPRASDA